VSDAFVDTVRLDEAKTKERFEILDEAGSGGMGIVYRARSTTTGTVVALKIMSVATGDPARFALETRVLSQLHHENIVAYHAHGTTAEGKPYLAMEWIEGETLQARVERERLAPAEAVRIARAITAALVHAHASGIVHRDLKPSNVLVTRDGAVKLVDFGVARILDLGRGLTATGQFVGTAGYMAPEQARDDAPVDGRADLFALGCVLFFALTGTRAFDGASPEAYLSKLLFGPIPSVLDRAPRTPTALADLVARLLEREREARPPDAASVLAELDSVLDAAPPPTPAAKTRRAPSEDRTLASHTRTPSPASRREPTGPRRWIALAVVLASAAALGWLFRTPTTPTTAPPASASALGSAAAPSDDRAATLRRACRDWSAALVRMQRDGGAFSGEEHRPPSGWDTAQQLFALARAKHACDSPAENALAAGVRGLAAYRTDAGWTGLGPSPAPELPATAWAALAAGALARVGLGAEGATSALALVRTSTRASGDFAFSPGSRRSDRYTSVLATWALVESAGDEKEPNARAAAAHLADELARDDVLRNTAGLEEQAAFVLLRARQKNLVAPPTTLPDILAHDLLARCRPVGDACTRALAEDDTIPLHGSVDGGDGTLVSLWHPWLTLASAALAVDPDLSPPLRPRLETMVAWSAHELTSAIAVVAVAPAYKLAEYLLVVTYLLDP
jgi:serine/threonine protein kinase